MSTIPVEHYQPMRSQRVAILRHASTADEAMRLLRLRQETLLREGNSLVRQAVMANWDAVRNLTVMIVILLSIVVGLLAPHLTRSLWIY